MRAVLIAAKHRAFAKTRLKRALPDPERMNLAEAMFRDVMAAALAARGAQCVALVTSDAGMLEAAQAAGVLAIDEGFPRGLNKAVALGTATLLAHGAETIVTLLSDIPMITSADIEETFSAIASAPVVVLVPSRDFSGTNVIARSPGDVISTHFGRQSLVRHMEDCRRRGIASKVLRLARPALDLDLPEDLVEFVRLGSPGATLNQLSNSSIARR